MSQLASVVDEGVGAEPAILVRGVSKRYHLYARPEDRLKQAVFGRWRTFHREFAALDGVDLTVRRGESVGIIGRNGAGKSTLLQIISGLLRPTAGEVRVNGRVAPLLQLGTSFNPEFSGLENISLTATILGLSEAEIARRREDIIAFAELGDFISEPVRTYSSGMSARLAFAIAAHVDAEILIVDEVLSVGDIGFTQKCARFLREFRERGTLLFVSHDIGAVLALCNRAVWIDRGRVIEDAAPKRLVPHYMTWMGAPDRETAAEFLSRVQEGGADGEGEASEPAAATKAEPAANPNGAAPLGQPSTVVEFQGFDWNARSTGHREGLIVDAWWENAKGERIRVIGSGDLVTLVVVFRADTGLLSPIIGFSVKDRLAQTIFAWDTSKEPHLLGNIVATGERLTARFTFAFPPLAGGDYTVNLALADGTADHNKQQHWLYNALAFHMKPSRLAQGMIGVAMSSVSFQREAS